MAKSVVFQVRMDSQLKVAAESLYQDLGMTFAEAVRLFAVQSLIEGGLPFSISTRKGTLKGALASYADSSLREKESIAFAMAVADKHGKAD
ncbi:MAG: type II toxin-antitoxin system RelB/DinJ family antitoxin [Spirochaetaceae bacterium]|nr:type II toxin-antitoxin system RelB/DinJ family antitoxin [Spirochaetaceae bacterium]